MMRAAQHPAAITCFLTNGFHLCSSSAAVQYLLLLQVVPLPLTLPEGWHTFKEVVWCGTNSELLHAVQ